MILAFLALLACISAQVLATVGSFFQQNRSHGIGLDLTVRSFKHRRLHFGCQPETMGSMTANCYWCNEFGSLYIPDGFGIGQGLCEECVAWMCNVEANPGGGPPKPDARDRAENHILDLFRNRDGIAVWAREVAELLHDWHEP